MAKTLFKKQSGLNMRRISFLVFLSVVFLLLLFAWFFLQFYTPGIAAMDGLPFISEWNLGNGVRITEDIEGIEYYEDLDGGADLDLSEIVPVDRRRGDSYTFLFIGRDDGLLTDSLMLMHLNIVENQISLLGIPRDSWINNRSYRGRINAVFANRFSASVRGGATRAQATTDGIAFLRQQIQITLGVPVDFYIFMDTAGFRALVDAVGGVEMYVPRNLRYSDTCAVPPLHINIQRGQQRLNGEQAEHLVRYRAGYVDQDIGRIAMQHRFLSALARQMLVFDVPQILRIFDVAATHITTNISVADMTWFARHLINVSLEDIITHTVPGEPARIGAASVWSVYRPETIRLINSYYNPMLADIPDGNFNIFEISRIHAHNANLMGVTMDQLLGN